MARGMGPNHKALQGLISSAQAQTGVSCLIPANFACSAEPLGTRTVSLRAPTPLGNNPP